MYSFCAAALTATVLMTTNSLAVDGRPAPDRPAVVQTVDARTIAPPIEWTRDEDLDALDEVDELPARPRPSLAGPHDDEAPGYTARPVQNYDSRGYGARGYDSRGYDSRSYDSRGYDSRGYDSRGYDSRGYDSRPYDSRGYGYDSRGYDSRGYRRGYEQDLPAAREPYGTRRPPPGAALQPQPSDDATLQPARTTRKGAPQSYELPRVVPPADGLVHIDVYKSGQYMIVTTVQGQRLRWPISTGRQGYETGEATNVKIRADRGDIDHHSKEYDGAPMPYVMWWNRARGLGIHGTDLNGKLGRVDSHGCIRLSRLHARNLFGMVLDSKGAILNIR